MACVLARRTADPTVAAALARDDDVAAAEPAVSATPSIATNDLAALRDLWYQVAAAPPDEQQQPSGYISAHSHGPVVALA